jgi:RNA polymerase sigma-70 factor (ECF subfamily)
MTEASGTRASLLVRIRNPRDQDAWRQFVGLYAPLIHRLARSRGLQDADAADLTQEVLRAVAATAAELPYDPKRGSFRGWLYTVARNRIYDYLTGPGQRERGTGDTATQRLLSSQAAPDDDAERWERDYQRHIFHVAAEQVRPDFAPATWQAFWLIAVEGQSAEEAARQLGLSVGAVYVAKCRVLARLKARVHLLAEE